MKEGLGFLVYVRMLVAPVDFWLMVTKAMMGGSSWKFVLQTHTYELQCVLGKKATPLTFMT
jgi:hypothetical protein